MTFIGRSVRRLALVWMVLGVMAIGLAGSAQARSRVYVLNLDSISVIDPFTNTVLETLSVSNAGDVVAKPDGSRVYVTSAAGLKVIDTSTNTVVATVPTSHRPDSLAILPDGSRVYAVTEPDVSVVDTATNTIVATIPFAPNLSEIAAHPDGSRVYLSRPGPGDDAVEVIDTATNAVIDTWDVFRPSSLSVHPDGDVVYVGAVVENYLQVRDADTGALIETLDLLGYPVGVVFSPDGLGFIANGIPPAGHGYVSILHPSAGVQDSVGVGNWIYGVAITPDGRGVYTTSRGLDRVSVVDGVTLREATRIGVGEHPQGVAVATTVACGDAYRDVGEGCDDGNLSNGDGCNAVCQLEIGCPPSPDLSCQAAGRGLFFVKEPHRPRLKIKLWDTPALTQADFGNPLGHGRTAYAVCIYDDAEALVEDLIVDRALEYCPIALAPDRPCWSATGGQPPVGKGYRFRNPSGANADGVAKMALKGGDAGRPKVLIQGRYHLPPGLPAALQNVNAVTVQFRSSDGACVSAGLSEIKRQSSTLFKAKTP